VTPIQRDNYEYHLDPVELRDRVKKFLDDSKALDIVYIDIFDKSTIADYLVIASGTSQRHIRSLADKLKEYLHKLGCRSVIIEGLFQCDWVLLDAGDIVVHIFRPEVRTLYNLEKMWGGELPV
jgi:ribosome-associated protein